MYELHINMPNLMDGATVELDGLGIFENGGTYEVSREEALAFQASRRVLLSGFDAYGNFRRIDIEGPTLEEAFEDVDGITVNVKEDAPDA